jgi:hypothetical protein
MRNGSAAIIGLTGILMISACSSSSTEQASKDKNVNTVANGNANVVVVANTSDVNAAYPVDPSAANFTGKRTDGSGLVRPNGLGPQPGNPSVSVADAREIASKSAQPAKDNSTFYSFLADAGYEVRTFNDNPHILKVEKKTTGEGKSTAKIFLRSGKVVEVDGKKIPQLLTSPLDDLLGLAGIQLPKPPPAPVGIPGKKPDQ